MQSHLQTMCHKATAKSCYWARGEAADTLTIVHQFMIPAMFEEKYTNNSKVNLI